MSVRPAYPMSTNSPLPACLRRMLFLAVSAVFTTPAAMAATLQVGPGQPFATPCAAIAAAHDNDSIRIDAAGDYAGDVCVIARNGLHLLGVNGRPEIAAAGQHAQGKATWVIQGDDTHVENIAFTGSRVPDLNGAGIRQEGHNLSVRDCLFRDNENGILGGVDGGTITIEYSEFDDNGHANGFAHNLYILGADRLVFRYNWSHRARGGHLLKSRARENIIAYNRMTGEADGTQSYEMNFPNGGRTLVIGNLLQQAGDGNNRMLDYLSEGSPHPDTHLYVVNNTFVNESANALFIQIGAGAAAALVRNNLFVGPGTLTNQAGAIVDHNLIGIDPMLVNAAGYDYRLAPGSPAIDAGIAPGIAGGDALAPTSVYRHPASAAPRTQHGPIDVGAYEAVPGLFVDGFE